VDDPLMRKLELPAKAKEAFSPLINPDKEYPALFSPAGSFQAELPQTTVPPVTVAVKAGFSRKIANAPEEPRGRE
jgi:hypothetical protein